MEESETFDFDKDHTKCGTCGKCAHHHSDGSPVKDMCEALKASGKKLPMGKPSFLKMLETMQNLSATKKGNPFAMSQKEFVKSLNPASATLYVPCTVRAISAEGIKFQGEGSMELEVYADPKIIEWVKKQPATVPSVAGTGVMYTVAQAIAHDKADPKVAGFAGPVRIQIKGPALNRDWGAEFVIDHPKMRAWAEQFAAYLKVKETAPEGKSAILDDESKPETDDEE